MGHLADILTYLGIKVNRQQSCEEICGIRDVNAYFNSCGKARIMAQ